MDRASMVVRPLTIVMALRSGSVGKASKVVGDFCRDTCMAANCEASSCGVYYSVEEMLVLRVDNLLEMCGRESIIAQLEYGRIGDCVATAQHGRNFARDYMKDMGNDF